MGHRNGTNPTVAIVAALLGLAFVVFVFVYDDLKASPFVQGTTGLIVALVITVVLFSAVPSKAWITKTMIGLAGGAAFYFLLLPKIEPFIFPLYSFTGYVAFESDNVSDKGFTPVEGAEVEIKDTGLKANTNSTGQFIIAHVPSQRAVNTLIIRRGGTSYTIETKKYPDRIFRIPRDRAVIKSSIYPFALNDWSETSGNGCALADLAKYTSTAQVLLTKNVHSEKSYSDLIVRVWCVQDNIEIIDARELRPSNGIKLRDAEDYSKAQKWQFPMTSEQTNVRLSVCVGTTTKDALPSKSGLQAAYWFQKIE